jgi:hypothetical protein
MERASLSGRGIIDDTEKAMGHSHQALEAGWGSQKAHQGGYTMVLALAGGSKGSVQVCSGVQQKQTESGHKIEGGEDCAFRSP